MTGVLNRSSAEILIFWSSQITSFVGGYNGECGVPTRNTKFERYSCWTIEKSPWKSIYAFTSTVIIYYWVGVHYPEPIRGAYRQTCVVLVKPNEPYIVQMLHFL